MVLLYLGFAFLVDPRRDFGTSIFPVVASDFRRDKMELFEDYNRRQPVEGLVLGSSRSMKLSCGELGAKTGLRWFNSSVDSARAEDYLAVYRWARSRDPRIRVLIVGLDVEALHDHLDWDDRLKANPELMSALRGGTPGVYRRTADFLARMKSVFTRYYVQDEFRSLQLARRPNPPTSALEDDGGLRYVHWESERAAGRFDLQRNMENSREEYRRRFAQMQGLSPERKIQVETLIREAQRDGVQVVLWITPVHPELAASLARETGYVTSLEETRIFAAKLRQEFAIPVFDLSTPAAFDGTDSGWYDGAHIDEENAHRVVARLAPALR